MDDRVSKFPIVIVYKPLKKFYQKVRDLRSKSSVLVVKQSGEGTVVKSAVVSIYCKINVKRASVGGS